MTSARFPGFQAPDKISRSPQTPFQCPGKGAALSSFFALPDWPLHPMKTPVTLTREVEGVAGKWLVPEEGWLCFLMSTA